MADNEIFKTALNKAMALCAGREYTAGEIIVKTKAMGY